MKHQENKQKAEHRMNILQSLLIASIMACTAPAVALAAPKAAETADDAVEIVPDPPRGKRNAPSLAGTKPALHALPKTTTSTKTAKPRPSKKLVKDR